ncbi:hypothetical protein ADT25_03095, partial [Xanthomonas oryzae]
FVVGVFGQGLEHPLPDAGPTPAAMSQMNNAEIPEAFREISPGNTGSIAIQHGIDKEPIVFSGHTDVAGSAGKQIADAIPLIVSQGVATCHCRKGAEKGQQASPIRSIDDTP